MAQLNEFLSKIDFEDLRAYCFSQGRNIRYDKGEAFTQGGRVGKYVGFVKSGYFKYCVITSSGGYSVTGFSFQDECIMDFTRSFLYSLPSNVDIIAGSEAEVIAVPLSVARAYIISHIPDFIPTATAVLLEESYRRYLNIYKTTPRERYLELVGKYNDLLKQVTMRDIASYLLITPTHLSRIRKKIM